MKTMIRQREQTQVGLKRDATHRSETLRRVRIFEEPS